MALKAVFDNIISKAAIDFSSSEIIDIVSAVEEMVHRFARNVTENTPDLKILRVLPCGSMREKSALWKTFVNNPRRPVVFEGIGEVPYIEFDFLAILEKPPEIEFTPTDCPGCNQVKHTPNERKRCSTDLKIYNDLGNMCSVSETSSGAVRARRICSRCETAFHGSLPWWPFDNWKTWKKVGSEEYLCTDLVDALFHNVVVSNMCPPCSCLRVSIKEVDCALIDCSNRKRCKVTRNKANRNIKCEKCTIVKDNGFLQLAVTSEANMMSHKRNKCSFILLWTSSSDKLSSFEPKELEWKKIDQLHVLVDFLPAFEVAHGKFHEEALLVAKRCSCCSDCCKWRVSYAVKEMDAILFETSEDHKKCYKIIKYIIHLFHYFDLNINSYHVKTVFLKHCKDCKIADGSFDKCINEVLLGLSIAYKTGHLEGFVNKSNLIKLRYEGFARELELVEQMFKEFETEFEVDGIDSSLLTQTLIGHLKQILLYFKTENDKITDTEPYHWHPDSYVRFGWQHTKKAWHNVSFPKR